MGRIKSLNGLPNEIVQKYLSTISYYDKGYMADWLWKGMNDLNISEAEIDLFHETTTPTELRTKPIIVYLKDIRQLIQQQLENYNFESDYIANGIFKISIDNLGEPFGIVKVQSILTTKDQRQIIGKVYKERTYPIADSFFKKALKAIK